MSPPLKPLPIKDRISMIFLQYGQVDVRGGAFVLIDKQGERMHIPVGSIACIMLEPGTRVSHAAIKLAATVGTLLVWVGESVPHTRGDEPGYNLAHRNVNYFLYNQGMEHFEATASQQQRVCACSCR